MPQCRFGLVVVVVVVVVAVVVVAVAVVVVFFSFFLFFIFAAPPARDGFFTKSKRKSIYFRHSKMQNQSSVFFSLELDIKKKKKEKEMIRFHSSIDPILRG